MTLGTYDRILHPKLGSGTVLAVDGRILTILFDSGLHARVIESFVLRWGDVEVKLKVMKPLPE